MEYSELTEEQRERVRACESGEELVELAQSEGVELSADQLEAIAGGSWNTAKRDS